MPSGGEHDWRLDRLVDPFGFIGRLGELLIFNK